MSIQTKKARVLLSSTKVLPKGHTRRKLWEVGKVVDLKGHWGSHTRNLHLLVTLRTVI